MWLGCRGERDGRKRPCWLLVRTAQNPGGGVLTYHLDPWGPDRHLFPLREGDWKEMSPLLEASMSHHVSLPLESPLPAPLVQPWSAAAHRSEDRKSGICLPSSADLLASFVGEENKHTHTPRMGFS